MNFKLDFSFSPYHVLPKKCNIMHFNNYTSFCNLANDKTLHVTHAKKNKRTRTCGVRTRICRDELQKYLF